MNLLKNVFKKKDESIKDYNDFWAWFQKNEKKFFSAIKKHDNIEKDFFDKISPKLEELKDGFFYLTGMYDDNTVELILTPDGNIKNIVFVEELVESAPNIQGWKFTALKPPLNIEDVNINMAGYSFNNKTLSFYTNDLKNYPDEIEIVVVHNDYNKEDETAITNGTYIFLDNFLGELNFITTVDSITVIGKDQAEKELIHIEKLKSFLKWREKEFLEKYEGERHNTESDSYSNYESELENGNPLLAVMNSTLLTWDRKASHPWLMRIKINYNGQDNSGLPDKEVYKYMDDFENEAMNALKDSEGYLNIGRETGDNLREIYFACKDFRRPSKQVHKLIKEYSNKLNINYQIHKDKYWKVLEPYIQ